jgi:signal transduction histidine kinase/DNA-binding response OmpR family regulator
MHAEHVRSHRTKYLHRPILVLLALLLFESTACSRTDSSAQLLPENNHTIIFAHNFAFPEQGLTSVMGEEFPVPAKRTLPERKWNWFIYIAILLFVLYIIRRYEVSRIRMKSQMKIATIEKEKLKDIDQLKSKFYANISHEFRTPLTLIKGPLEQLMDENTDPHNRKVFRLMHSNASRLLELINQLLDLSKIESGYYSIKAVQHDIVDFVSGLAMSFTSLADQKDIALEVKVSPKLHNSEARTSFYYDPDVFDKIINNLISNAFKFTPKGGRITIHMSLIGNNDADEFLEIAIEDTGMGIAPDTLPYIFDRFYQEDSHSSHFEGTGIGLSIVHELIHLHKGEISVQSELDKGTIFRIRIPSGSSHLSPDQLDNSGSGVDFDALPLHPGMPEETMDSVRNDTTDQGEHPWVLVVEDHEQVRRYIADSIQKEYRVLQATNAPEGYKIALEYIPDLIISDVMMPGIDGFRFCEKIKNCRNTSHIPIILLTAKADINDRITGLKWGADDYLTKPFNAEELRIRICNLIDNRNALRQKFSSNKIIKPGEISVSSHDALFIQTLLELVEKNMNNIYYTVEEFAKDSGLSQSQLHRKLKAIISISAIQFIRSVRMHRAMELLKNGAGNIAEVAYMVGYDDPGYFSKSFRKFFDKLPSEVTTA